MLFLHVLVFSQSDLSKPASIWSRTHKSLLLLPLPFNCWQPLLDLDLDVFWFWLFNFVSALFPHSGICSKSIYFAFHITFSFCQPGDLMLVLFFSIVFRFSSHSRWFFLRLESITFFFACLLWRTCTLYPASVHLHSRQCVFFICCCTHWFGLSTRTTHTSVRSESFRLTNWLVVHKLWPFFTLWQFITSFQAKQV